MRFSVPQFIDVEDKIFGPLTLKQAVYLVGGGGGTYIAYAVLGAIGVIFVGIPLVAFAILLGFVQVNNRPFSAAVAAAFFYKMKRKLYLWKKAEPKNKGVGENTSESQKTQNAIASPELIQSKLRTLAFSLDTEENYSTQDQ